MKFQNTNAQAELNFSILGKTYKVEAGAEVEIEPAHVPWVLRRGLQLEASVLKPKPKAAPAKPEVKPAKPADPKPAPEAKPAEKPVEKQEKPADK